MRKSLNGVAQWHQSHTTNSVLKTMQCYILRQAISTIIFYVMQIKMYLACFGKVHMTPLKSLYSMTSLAFEHFTPFMGSLCKKLLQCPRCGRKNSKYFAYRKLCLGCLHQTTYREILQGFFCTVPGNRSNSNTARPPSAVRLLWYLSKVVH